LAFTSVTILQQWGVGYLRRLRLFQQINGADVDADFRGDAGGPDQDIVGNPAECRLSESIVAMSSDRVMSRSLAISFSDCQNASSRLTLVTLHSNEPGAPFEFLAIARQRGFISQR
jgi:hypothetical protein